MSDRTPVEALAGTSGTQRAEASAALVKQAQPGRGGPLVSPQAIGETNVRSIFWGMHTLLANGTHNWNFGFPLPVQIFHDSQVSVSMTEVDGNGTPFVGLAGMQVYNVVPHEDGTVTVRFNVDWGSQLRVLFNFIIVN